jgi:predicted nucleic acid-binding protein
MIVLDANILIRAVLGRRVRRLLEDYTPHGIRFYAPDVAFADAQNIYRPCCSREANLLETSPLHFVTYKA